MLIDHRLRVVGKAIDAPDFHRSGFRFDRMMMVSSVRRQLRQPRFDLLAQSLTLGQACGQTIAGRFVVPLRQHHLGLVQRGVQGGQQFLHIFLAPAAVTAGGRFDFGAIQRLQDQADGSRAQGQLGALFENLAQGLFVVPRRFRWMDRLELASMG
jgi:hypothetical protein